MSTDADIDGKQSGKRVYLGFCSTYAYPGIIERVGRDWDWIWLDGQHGALAGYDAMLSMVRACNYVGVPAYVRVPTNDPAWIGLALDMNADAVIVPQVDSVADAVKAVRAGKFPPLGNRSYGGRRVIDVHGREYSNDANHRTRVICQIESTEAVDQVAEIAAVDGVDGLFFGPDDWGMRQGMKMTAPDLSRVGEAVRKVASACRAAGKDCFAPGMGAEASAAMAKAGVNYIVGGSDGAFLAISSKNASAASREAIEGVLRNTATAGATGVY